MRISELPPEDYDSVMIVRLKAALARWLGADGASADERALADINRGFVSLSPQKRIEQAAELLPAEHVLTSSFGAQAAVMLHLTNSVIPRIPVSLIDTGYLFPETYRFIDELTGRLNLNLKVFRSDASPAWQESGARRPSPSTSAPVSRNCNETC